MPSAPAGLPNPLLLAHLLCLFSPVKVREMPVCLGERAGVWGSVVTVAKGSQGMTQDREGVLCSLGGSPSSTWDHRCPPSWKPCPGCSSLPHSSNIRFSLCPVLHPSSLPWSPGLELHGEEAGGLCPLQ